MSTKVGLTTINIQSLKLKELTLTEHLGSNDADMCVVTETWLNDDDQVWLQSSKFNKNGWKCYNINRQGRQGGGLTLIYHDRYHTKCHEQGATRSFEYGIWQVKSSKLTNVIIAIYHPPYSDVNPVTNSMFIDDFTDWIGEIFMTYDNIIIRGDFNLHVNEVDDPEIQVFNNTITALGFNQVVDFETHKQGNHLDLILVEELSKPKIANCFPGPYLSDHCTVETVLTQNREDMLRISVTNRKLHNIDQQQFITDLKLQDLNLIQPPDDW